MTRLTALTLAAAVLACSPVVASPLEIQTGPQAEQAGNGASLFIPAIPDNQKPVLHKDGSITIYDGCNTTTIDPNGGTFTTAMACPGQWANFWSTAPKDWQQHCETLRLDGDKWVCIEPKKDKKP